MNNLEDDYLERARRLHRQAVVIDTHCDTTLRLAVADWRFNARHNHGHVDLPRLQEGGVDAVFFAVWVPGSVDGGAAVEAARQQIHRIQQMIVGNHDGVAAARTANDIRRARNEGKIAILLAIEGGHLIEDSLEILREYRARGAAYLTVTHAFHTSWADSAGVHEALKPLHGGLTAFGRDVVIELNRLGMMVDVSHASDATVRDVLETSVAPVIATHSSCQALSPHCRNLSDEMMRAIAATGGTVQINFCAAFIDPEFPRLDSDRAAAYVAAGGTGERPLTDHVTPLECLVDHFDHALQLIGPDHVGIGSDFDGVPALPTGMEDCARLPHLTAALLRRGYGETDLAKVLGGNVLRVMEACRNTATKLEGEGKR